MLFSGIPTSRGRWIYLHETSKRVWTSRQPWKREILPEIIQEYILTETSREGVELASSSRSVEIYYTQSKTDSCLYYRIDTLLAVYSQYRKIESGSSQGDGRKLQDIRWRRNRWVPGSESRKTERPRIKTSQPTLTEQILKGLEFNERTKIKRTRAVASEILHKDKEEEELQT